MYWLVGRKSQLSIENKLLLYKCIIKPVWTYGLQLWGTAANSNVEIIQRFQSKILRTMVDAPWFVTIETLHRDLGIPIVRNEINKVALNHKAKTEVHPNTLVAGLMAVKNSRLKRKRPVDLITEK